VTMVRARLYEQEIRQAIGAPGEGDLVVEGVAPLDAAEDRCVCFVNKELTPAVRESLARRDGCIVIVPTGSALAGQLGGCRVLEADDPRAAIAKVLGLVRALGRQRPWVDSPGVAPGASISPLAVVDAHVRIDDGVEIEPFCTVGPDVSIGRGSVLRAGVRVHPRVSIGEESSIGPNSVIGLEGFGFVRDEAGDKTRMPQLAGVVVGSHVEIEALVVVQGGAIETTTIEDHAKIDSHVMVGHGVRVRRGATVTGATLLGGSSEVGAEAWVGMNSSVREGRRVGSSALVGMDSSVQHDVEDDAITRAPRPDVTSRPGDDDRAGIGFAWRRPRGLGQ
jgi:UDP-3-O-[3-hydroxymyristoyl] glucosamine N-acyltransferase LpxD